VQVPSHTSKKKGLRLIIDRLLGPAGITAVAALLDKGVPASDILWIGTLWCNDYFRKENRIFKNYGWSGILLLQFVLLTNI